MDAFKIPQAIPQDLLLIQELIGAPEPSNAAPQPPAALVQPSQSTAQDDDDISSSGEENDSEDEIAADLITGAATDEDDLTKNTQKSLSEPSESTSDSSDSDSDSSSDGEDGKANISKVMLDLDDDEDPVPAASANTYFTTKHEVVEAEIPIPEVDEVESDEVLEKVGEVMNIVDRLVIVRGLPADSPAGYPARGSDRALDSDTLLVFDDRKVMGYVYETFGPTTQPFYQVKFNSAFPLDPERVRVGREVFHVPTRSRFVFVNQIKAFKGSDASNVHDEEPADDELEFSDDEAEAAYKSRLKRKRGESRARSVASSRQSTPNPTLMRDQELAEEAFLGRNAYDEHGPYDIDYASPGPSSRPAPIPYDDPYGDAYTAPDVADREAPATAPPARSSWNTDSSTFGSSRGGRRGEEKGYERHGGPGRERGGDRGRTGGRGRERGGRSKGRGGGDRVGRGFHQQRHTHDAPETYESRSLSPTSFAIARATGQSSAYTQSQPQPYQQHNYGQQDLYSSAQVHPQDASPWGYAPMAPQYHAQQTQQMHQYSGSYGGYQQQNQAYQNQFDFGAMVGAQGAAPFVQPHINPRFASAFGLGGLPQMSQGYSPAAVGMASNNVTPPSLPVRAPGLDVSVAASSASSTGWAATTDEWAVSVQHGGTPGSTLPGSAANRADMETQK